MPLLSIGSILSDGANLSAYVPYSAIGGSGGQVMSINGSAIVDGGTYSALTSLSASFTAFTAAVASASSVWNSASALSSMYTLSAGQGIGISSNSGSKVTTISVL